MIEPVNACLALHTEGVALILDVTAGGLPAVAHWGLDIGELDMSEIRDLLRAGVNPVMANLVDEPVHVALLLEHWRGWVGRPGLSGSRVGQDWSPKFTSVALRLNGESIRSSDGSLTLRNHDGPAVVEVDAVDDTARLALSVTVELTVGGLVRARAILTNRGEPYQLDDLVLSLPVPGVAGEILDFGGRWGRERTPQRRQFTVGTDLCEGRKGRTGADAATVLHVGRPGFDFTRGEIWGVHIGWSGNHTHYAERLSTG